MLNHCLTVGSLLFKAGCAVILLFSSWIWASNRSVSSVHFIRYTIDDGLSNPTIYDMVQDDLGFLWIATPDGLNRFDGYEFLVYRHHSDHSSISTNRIFSLHPDGANGLWIGSEGGGLEYLDFKTNRFKHFRHDPEDPHSLPGNTVFSIIEDAEGSVWVGCDRGVARYDSDKDRFDVFVHDPSDDRSISAGEARVVLEDARQRIWIGLNGGGLNLFNPKTNQFTRFAPDPNRPTQSLISSHLFSMCEGPANILWLGTDRGLQRFDPLNMSFEKIPESQIGVMSKTRIYALVNDKKGSIWVGSFGEGMVRFKHAKGLATHFRHDPIFQYSLVDDKIRSLFLDRFGVLWVGTNNGLNRFNPNLEAFTHYGHHPFIEQSLPFPDVTSLLQDRFDPDLIWIGTAKNLTRLDRKRTHFTTYHNDPDDAHAVKGEGIYKMYQDRAGTLWIGSTSALNRYDRENDRFDSFTPEPDDPQSLTSGDIWSMLEDSKGRFWVGTWQAGLNLFDRETGKSKAYVSQPGGLSNDSVMDIVEDNQGFLWLATYGGGLNRFDPDRDQFTIFHPMPGSAGLNQDMINALYMDHSGMMWLATDGGLSQFNPKTGSFKTWHEKDGLSNGRITGIVEDNRGFLWMLSNNSVSRFDTVNLEFMNLQQRDGVQSKSFNRAIISSESGEIFAGGDNGLVTFDPNRLKRETSPPMTVITKIRISNFDLPIGEHHGRQWIDASPAKASFIHMDHQDPTLSIEFAGLHYADPDTNTYAYKLDGFDTKWTEADSRRRIAHYTNIKPGQYAFRVKSANRDGVWSEEHVIPVTVSPAPWRTPMAYFLYALVIVALFILVEYRRLRRKRKLEFKNTQLALVNHELRTLDDIVKTINREVSLAALLNVLLKQGLRLFPRAERGAFVLLDDTGKHFKVHAIVGYGDNLLGSLFEKNELINRYTRHSVEIAPQIYVVTNPKGLRGPEHTQNISSKSMLVMAMTNGSELLGFVVWDNVTNEDAFNEVDPLKIQRFREHAVSAVSKVHFMSELEQKNNEILKTRDQLIIQEKMASLGALTAGIAHEIRNPLNFVNNFAEITRDRFTELREELKQEETSLPPHLFAYLDEILEELEKNAHIIGNHGRRAEKIVGSMMQMASPQSAQLQETDVNALVEQFTDIAIQGFTSKHHEFGLEVLKSLGSGCQVAWVGPQNLSRVIINLITNALEALWARYLEEPGFQPVLKLMTQESGDVFEIRVIDNGVGVSPDHQKRIFNPFFTTKSPESGNVGLGLSISYEIIVHEHQGDLKMHCSEDRTEFVVSLPKRPVNAPLTTLV